MGERRDCEAFLKQKQILTQTGINNRSSKNPTAGLGQTTEHGLVVGRGGAQCPWATQVCLGVSPGPSRTPPPALSRRCALFRPPQPAEICGCALHTGMRVLAPREGCIPPFLWYSRRSAFERGRKGSPSARKRSPEPPAPGLGPCASASRRPAQQ